MCPLLPYVSGLVIFYYSLVSSSWTNELILQHYRRKVKYNLGSRTYITSFRQLNYTKSVEASDKITNGIGIAEIIFDYLIKLTT